MQLPLPPNMCHFYAFWCWHRTYVPCRYVGHLKERSLKDQMAKDPTEVIRKAVLRMLPRNKLRDVSVWIWGYALSDALLYLAGLHDLEFWVVNCDILSCRNLHHHYTSHKYKFHVLWLSERAIKLDKNNRVDHYSKSNKLAEAIWCASINFFLKYCRSLHP